MSENPTPPQAEAPAPARSRQSAPAPETHSSPAEATSPAPGQVGGYKVGQPWAGNTRYVCNGVRLGRPCGFDELNESRMQDHVLAEHPEIA
jgi:hypothetical protein